MRSVRFQNFESSLTAAVSEELRESLGSLRTGGLSLSAGYRLRP